MSRHDESEPPTRLSIAPLPRAEPARDEASETATVRAERRTRQILIAVAIACAGAALWLALRL